MAGELSQKPTYYMRVSTANESRITAEMVRAAFHYNTKTGKLIRRERNNRSAAGTEAGRLNHHGYRIVNIGCRSFAAHRIVWLHVYGAWPKGLIDHVNGRKSDNRIANLREANYSENGRNRKPNRTNKTGVLGVWWSLRKERYIAHIAHHGKKYNLGIFKTIEEATAARVAAEKRLFGEFIPFHRKQEAPNGKHLSTHGGMGGLQVTSE